MSIGSGSPFRASGAASRSEGSNSQASPVVVENSTLAMVTKRPLRSAARPDSYRIVNVTNTNTNIGRESTDGIDLALNYSLPTEVGRFGFILDGTWLHKVRPYPGGRTIIHARGTVDIATTGGVYHSSLRAKRTASTRLRIYEIC